MKKRLKALLPDNIKTDLAFQGKHLSPCFKIKDKTDFPHKHYLVCHTECPVENCNDDYVGVIEKEIKIKQEHRCRKQINKPSLNKQEKSIPLKLFKMFFLPFLLLIYLFEVIILTLVISLC